MGIGEEVDVKVNRQENRRATGFNFRDKMAKQIMLIALLIGLASLLHESEARTDCIKHGDICTQYSRNCCPGQICLLRVMRCRHNMGDNKEIFADDLRSAMKDIVQSIEEDW